MLRFVYDRRGSNGFVPNLITDTPQLEKILAVGPHGVDFELKKYLEMEGILFEETQTKYYRNYDGVYPISLGEFDVNLDYFSLMRPEAVDLVRKGQLTILFYCPIGKDPATNIIPRISYLADAHQIDQNRIKFVCANAWCEKYDNFIYMPVDEIRTGYLSNQSGDYVTQVKVERRNKKFSYIDIIDSPWSRLLAASLWYHGLHNDSFFSYRAPGNFSSFEHSPVWQWHACWEKPRKMAELFSMNLPYTNDLASNCYYSESYWSLISESYFSNQDLSLSVNTFKPILNMQPFIMIGPPGSLKLLRDLGYKTFGNYIDESYDSVQNDEKRLYKCFQLAFYLYNLSHKEHLSLMKIIKPILVHNQDVLLGSKKHTLLQTLDKIQ